MSSRAPKKPNIIGKRITYDLLRRLPEGPERDCWRKMLGEYDVLPEDRGNHVSLNKLMEGEARIKLLNKIRAMMASGEIQTLIPKDILIKTLGKDWKKYMNKQATQKSPGVFLPVYPDTRFIVMLCPKENPPVWGVNVKHSTKYAFATKAKAMSWIFDAIRPKNDHDCWILKVNGRVSGMSISGIISDVYKVSVPAVATKQIG